MKISSLSESSILHDRHVHWNWPLWKHQDQYKADVLKQNDWALLNARIVIASDEKCSALSDWIW